MAKVTKAAISIALSRGRIHAEPDGSINPKRKENAAYLTTSKRQRRQGKRKTGGKKTAKQKQRVIRSAKKPKKKGKRIAKIPEGGGPLEIDGETYGMAELRKIVAQADKEEQQNAIRRGELVERKDVKLIFAHIYTILGSQVKTLHEKVGPDVAAAFGLAEEKITRVQEIMSIDELRALSQIKKEFNAYLDSIGESLIE